jgi:endoglycosylceramidase
MLKAQTLTSLRRLGRALAIALPGAGMLLGPNVGATAAASVRCPSGPPLETLVHPPIDTGCNGAFTGTVPGDDGQRHSDGIAPRRLPPGPRGQLGHRGRWLIDRGGRVVILHGINMMNKLPPYDARALGFDGDDVDFLARSGFNSVRLGFDFGAFMPAPGVFNMAYLHAVDRTVRLLASRGIFTLLSSDLNCYSSKFGGQGLPNWMARDDGIPSLEEGFPACYTSPDIGMARAFDHFWADDLGPGGLALQQWNAAGWQRVAAFFAHRRYMLGYDLFNEPTRGLSSTSSCTGACFEDAVTQYYRRVVGAIRRSDRHTLIWVEPQILFDGGIQTHLGNINDRGIGFAYHNYCPFTADYFATGQETTDQECKPTEQQVIDNAEAYARRTGAATLEDEWGATNDISLLKRNTDLGDHNMTSWDYWAYWDQDRSGARPQEGIIYSLSQPPTGSNVKWDKVRALVRAYPSAVAGTPTSFGYDRTSGVFHLSYRTIAVGGRHVRNRATVIVLPKLDYPSGYRVLRLRGAQIVSRRGAVRLVIINKRHASNVSISVGPRTSPRHRRHHS